MTNIVLAAMTLEEAQNWKSRIGSTANQLRVLLFEGYERGAWEALGYGNWTDCVKALAEEYGFTERRLWQLHAANQTEKLLNHGSVGELPERALRPLTSLEPEQQVEVYQRAIETAPNGRVTAAHIVRTVEEMVKPPLSPVLESHQYINQSGNNEWYTPAVYIEAVHEVMGGIDTDPASNPIANKTIQAQVYFTKDTDGYVQNWPGRVFLNPPYGFDGSESNQSRWSKRLLEQFHNGATTEAILLVNAVPGNRWFAPLWNFPICFPDHRIRFYDANGDCGQPTHSNAFVYMGPNVQRFVNVFSHFGVVAARLAPEQG